MSNTTEQNDITDWMDMTNGSMDYTAESYIYDTIMHNEGCADSHYKLVLSSGETISLERV